MSPPEAIWRAERKPYQLAVAARLGLLHPRTVVTNEEEVARQFAQVQQVVVKAVHSGYIEEPEANRAIFTSDLNPRHLEDLSGLTLAPVTFQQKIEKISDIRVTVVGGEVFAAEILSQSRESSKVDWRATDDPNLEHRRHELPPTIAQDCRRLVDCLGLNFGAIDFALEADGTYVFLEINPNGEWLWLEHQLGQPIANRIAEWLSS